MRIVSRKIAGTLDVIQGRAVQVRAAADEKGHLLRQRLQDFAASFAGRDFRIGWKSRNLPKKVRRNFLVDRVVE